MSSLFSKIIARETPARIIHEDELCMAFHDIHPQAPVHLLVIPKQEIPRLAETQAGDQPLLGHLLATANQVAGMLGLHANGYRIVINNGQDGGETVPHLHLHVLGGRALSWPPG